MKISGSSTLEAPVDKVWEAILDPAVLARCIPGCETLNTVGEDHASLGSDWDGAICPPRDLLSPLDLPRLVEHMLRRRWTADRIQKILATNYLRVVEAVRG